MLIILDVVPLSKNKYVNAHWATRKRYQTEIAWLIKQYMLLQKSVEPDIYKDLPFKKAKIQIDIFFKTHRRRDLQNYLGGGLIAWFDALVDLGFIVDDNYDCIGQPKVFFYYDNEFPRTEVLIEGVANGNK